MDENTRTDVIDALRDAARALRLAEKALVTSPVSPTAGPAPATDAAPLTQQVNPVEEALFQYVMSEAQNRKLFEETNSAGFGVLVADQGDELLKFASDRRLYRVAPGVAGTVRPEPTASRSVFERLLKTMTGCKLDAMEVLRPLAGRPDLKNWSDVNPETDLVLMQYESPGPVEHQLDAAKLQTLVESARLVPGSVERVASRLKENAVRWEPIVRDAVNPSIQIENVEAKWSAVVDLGKLATCLTDLLSAIDVDASKSQSPWWPAAQADSGIPDEVLPLVRGGERYALLQREAADRIEDWASKLPGWFEDQPLIIRDVSTNEVLSQNAGDAMSNQTGTLAKQLAHVEKLLASHGSNNENEGDSPECPLCGGPGMSLGSLGKRAHYRCRDCGIDFSSVGASDDAAKTSGKTPPSAKSIYNKYLSDNASDPNGKTYVFEPTNGMEPDFFALQEAVLGDMGVDADQLAADDELAFAVHDAVDEALQLWMKNEENKGADEDLKSASVAASKKPMARKVRAEAPPAGDAGVCHDCAGKLKKDAKGKKVCTECEAEWSGEKTEEEKPLVMFANANKKLKAADVFDIENKTYLRKLNRLIKMGLLSADEVTGAVVEALRLAKVNSRLAGAVAQKVKDALVDANAQVLDVSARAKRTNKPK